MIRWRFVVTRLVIIVFVVMLLRWGLGPVAEYATIRSLQAITGAKVEVASTEVGLFPPRVQYQGVQVADPRSGKALRNAVSADSIELVIDGEALLQRRLIARDGRIAGLQVGARRADSGHLVRQDQPAEANPGPSLLTTLLAATTDHIARQADAMVDDLETVRRSQQIRGRWETEYSQLIDRARKLEKQIRDVRDRARGIDNPLRDWPEFERTLADAREARNELLSVHQELNKLPERLQSDLIQLDDAKRIDIATVDQFIPGDIAGASEFGIDMMAGAIRDQIQRVRGYLDGGRTIANYTVVAPEAARIRGVDHDLVQVHRPQVLVRRCEVGGLLRADGEVYSLTGMIENLTNTPDLLAEPTRARLSLEGPEIVRVEYVCDRRSNADVDWLTVHWPEMDAESARLGSDRDAVIQVQGGQRELWVQLKTEGEQIEGRLVSKQSGVELSLNVDQKYAQSAAVVSLQESLAAVDRIEIDARFSGTWQDVDLKLNSNLGQVMRRATQDAVEGQMRQSQQLLATKIEQVHAEQTAALRNWLGQQQRETLSLLASADKSIEEMSAKVFDEVGVADEYLGKLRGTMRGKLR